MKVGPSSASGNEVSATSTRVEKSREIAARLEVRRRFYRGGFLVFTVIVLSVGFSMIGIDPSTWPYMLAWIGSSLLGTAVVLWWLYAARESSLYADAGRQLLDGR